jgi:hypothetical protein
LEISSDFFRSNSKNNDAARILGIKPPFLLFRFAIRAHVIGFTPFGILD